MSRRRILVYVLVLLAALTAAGLWAAEASGVWCGSEPDTGCTTCCITYDDGTIECEVGCY